MPIACNDTDHHQCPMLVDHLTLGHRRPVTVQNPEDRRHLRPGFDLASHEDVSVADVRPARLAVDDRSVCSRSQCKDVTTLSSTFVTSSSLSVASLGWMTREGGTKGVTPLFFPEKFGELFLVASSAVSPLISSAQKLNDLFCSSLYRFLLLSLGCHPPPLEGVTPHLFYLSDLVSPLFFVNLPTNFFPSGVTPGGCQAGRSAPPSDATDHNHYHSRRKFISGSVFLPCVLFLSFLFRIFSRAAKNQHGRYGVKILEPFAFLPILGSSKAPPRR